jgi:hypothetical protein
MNFCVCGHSEDLHRDAAPYDGRCRGIRCECVEFSPRPEGSPGVERDLALSPLSLATEDELVIELRGRCNASLIVLLKNRPGADCFFLDYHGLTACIGLAERAKARLLQEALSPSEGDLGEGYER